MCCRCVSDVFRRVSAVFLLFQLFQSCLRCFRCVLCGAGGSVVFQVFQLCYRCFVCVAGVSPAVLQVCILLLGCLLRLT